MSFLDLASRSHEIASVWEGRWNEEDWAGQEGIKGLKVWAGWGLGVSKGLGDQTAWGELV